MSNFGAIKSNLSQLRLDPADATKIQFALPSYTTAEESALTPRVGDKHYNTDLGTERTWTGSAWIDVGTYLDPGTGAVRRTQQQKNEDFLNAADFGFATGNTAAANTTALQAAITKLGATGGTININRGTFAFNGVTLPVSAIQLIGAGVGSTVLNYAAATGSAFKSSNTATTRSNIKIINCTVACTGGAGNTAVGIDFTSIGHSELSRVAIQEFGVGLLIDAATASAYYNNFFHIYFSASNAGSGYIGVKLLQSANAQRFWGCTWSRLATQVQVGTAALAAPPNEVSFLACTFESADTVGVDILRGQSIRIQGGRFEGNALGWRTAADANNIGIVVDSPYYGGNTSNFSDSGPDTTRSGRGSGNAISYGAGLSSLASAPNLLPNALLEGWADASTPLAWSSLVGSNMDSTGVVVREATIKQSGSYSAKCGNGTSNSRGIASPAIEVNASRSYTFTCFWTTAEAAVSVRFGYRCLDSADALVTTGTFVSTLVGATENTTANTLNYDASFQSWIIGSNQTATTPGTMQRWTHILRFPANTAKVRISAFTIGSTGTNIYFYLDQAALCQGVAPERAIAKPAYDSGDQTIYGGLTVSGNAIFKGGPWFDVKGYGAVGDGVANDTAAITAALAAAASGQTVRMRGTFSVNLTASYTVPSGVTLDLGTSTFLRQDTTRVSTFKSTGSLTRTDNLTGNAAKGSRIVAIADTSAYSAGDVVVVTDTGLGTTTLGGVTESMKRLMTRVQTVDSGTQLTLEDPLDDAFTTANTARVELYAVSEDVVINGGRTIGASHFTADYAANVRVEHCYADGWANAPAVAIYRTFGYHVSDVECNRPTTTTSGNGYGVAIIASSRGHVADIRGIATRHLVIYSVGAAHGTGNGASHSYAVIDTLNFHGANVHGIVWSDVTCVQSRQSTAGASDLATSPDHNNTITGILSIRPASYCYSELATNYGMQISGRCFEAQANSAGAWQISGIDGDYDVVAGECVGRGLLVTSGTNLRIRATILDHRSTNRGAIDFDNTGFGVAIDGVHLDARIVKTSAFVGLRISGHASAPITRITGQISLSDIASTGITVIQNVDDVILDVQAVRGASTDFNAGGTGVSDVQLNLVTRGRTAGSAFTIDAAADVDYVVNEAGKVTHSENLAIGVAGKGLQIKEGSNAKMGTATLVNGTVTVSTTAVTASSRIFLTRRVAGGTVRGMLEVGTITAATSFVINAVDTAGSLVDDDSVVSWLIVEPA